MLSTLSLLPRRTQNMVNSTYNIPCPAIIVKHILLEHFNISCIVDSRKLLWYNHHRIRDGFMTFSERKLARDRKL